MNSFNTHGPKSYTASATVRDHRLVQRTAAAGTVAEATNAAAAKGFAGIAYLQTDQVVAGEQVTVRPLTRECTLWAAISGAVAYGDPLYAAAAGKLSATVVEGALIGYAEQAGADGDEIEFRPV